MRAAVYCRISLDRKVKTGEGAGSYTMLGVKRQEEDCRQLCAGLGWEVVEVYVDNDVSATSGKPRPAYRAMLDAVRRGHVDAIVTWHPDRLYRRTTDLEELVDVVEATKSPIATVNAGAIDLTTPSGRLVARLLGATARYEVEHKTERWQRGVRQRREQGVPFGGGPRLYGYTREGEVEPDEAAHILFAAELLSTGTISIAEVARRLDARGSYTTRGNRWSAKALRQVLVNPRLAGWVTMKGEVVAKSSWPPILSQEQHELLTARLARKRTLPPRPRVASLIGVVHCGECGARLITGRRHEPSVRTYRCPARSHHQPGNGCVEVLAERLEGMVEHYARTRLNDPQVRERLNALTTDNRARKAAQEVAALEARLRELGDELAHGDGRTVKELRQAMDRVRDKLEAAEGRLASLPRPGGVPPAGPDGIPWPTDAATRGALVQLVVERVELRKSATRGGAFAPERVTILPRC